MNDINSNLRFARAFHVREGVLVEADLVGESVDPLGFRTACEAVGHVADTIGTSLAKKYCGRRALEAHGDSPPTGMYL